MARISKTTPAAAASRTNVTTPAAPPATRSRQKKTKTPPAAAQPAPAPAPAKPMAPPAAPKSRTKKTPAAATPPAPAPAPAKKTVPPGAEVIEIPDYPTPARSGKKGDRKRAASSPSSPIDVDEIEMWTPRQKIRVDEDCCILSADPLAADKPRPVVVPAAAGDDDLAVLAERGQVACRDFPHARHACAKYPFARTPHHSHCEQCYCFVCDIAAPCATWKGHANYGHCHASDKDKFWMTMRGVARAKLQKT
ncbi:uncharacterized protein [Lolium perenne]|uniref:uncharacterized protein n=1 Tax=Lolium perenne TaxID=4522 RepID=UPI0021F59C26|nr:uncharacterized protein LOC127310898 [Lolium perenne]